MKSEERQWKNPIPGLLRMFLSLILEAFLKQSDQNKSIRF